MKFLEGLKQDNVVRNEVRNKGKVLMGKKGLVNNCLRKYLLKVENIIISMVI